MADRSTRVESIQSQREMRSSICVEGSLIALFEKDLSIWHGRRDGFELPLAALCLAKLTGDIFHSQGPGRGLRLITMSFRIFYELPQNG